ncbi:MAG: DUF302 domain-containing protein [Pseudolysinimonas sp.]
MGGTDDGLVTRTCSGSVEEVLGRLRSELDLRGLRLFAVIDHGEAARDVGLELNHEVVAVFGNAAVGTKLMQRNPRAGIDLPLRILIWDDHGTTMTAYTPATVIGERFALDPAELPIDKLTDLLEELSVAVSRPTRG